MLTNTDVVEVASHIYSNLRDPDRKRLEKIQKYVTNSGTLAWLPMGAPTELQAMSRMSRVPLANLVIQSTTQQMFVDGYKSEFPDTDAAVWNTWQRNHFDRQQIATHRSACSYGAGYVVTLPGNPVPVMRPVSPLKITVAYPWNDDTNPEYALEDIGRGRWRLYDKTHVYVLQWSDKSRRSASGSTLLFDLVDSFSHDAGFCPVVRYLSDVDIDNPVSGDVEPVIPLIDQIQLTTFHLLVAQHYGAHGRRVIIGSMVKELEQQMVAAGANSMMTINASPEDVSLEQFDQTQLDGFIDARRSAMELLGSVSQTPTHELLGTIANLSAAALQESRESTDRKISEREMTFGESHEQVLGNVAQFQGLDVDPLAEVRWKQIRPTRQKDLVDLLVVLSENFDVPRDALLEHLPFSASEIEEFRNNETSSVVENDVSAVTEEEL